MDNTLSPIRDYGNYLQHASPLVMGAGQIDPNRALDPGLIYDASPQDYVNLLCSLNLTKEQISVITKSNGSNCSNPCYDLNYPTFIALYGGNNTIPTVREYHRTETNVGKGQTTYNVMVTEPEGSVVKISPETLFFSEKNEKKSYTVSITYEVSDNKKVSFGALVWVVEENGEHIVRSPIVISPLKHFL